MIETPEGVANAEKIAAVPGIDVIFAASTDLGNFSGHKQGEPQYEALVTRIKEATLARGIKLGGPLACLLEQSGVVERDAGPRAERLHGHGLGVREGVLPGAARAGDETDDPVPQPQVVVRLLPAQVAQVEVCVAGDPPALVGA